MSATTQTRTAASMLTARPARLPSGGWGIQLARGQRGKAGDLAVVTTKSGKRWVAYLSEFRNESRWGEIWASQRTDFEVPEEAPAAPMRPQARRPQWYGTPFKIGDDWGCIIDRDQTLVEAGPDHYDYGDEVPREGDIVLIESSKGKKWKARLACGGHLNRRRHRFEFLTERI
jgi:hypothetical protein